MGTGEKGEGELSRRGWIDFEHKWRGDSRADAVNGLVRKWRAH